jgi:hypothetical protein
VPLPTHPDPGAHKGEAAGGEKLLEDTQIKLSAVISDIVGASGRAMPKALLAGQRGPSALAQMARGSMRGKISALQEALTGARPRPPRLPAGHDVRPRRRAHRPDRGPRGADR